MKILKDFTSVSINTTENVLGGDNGMGMKRELTYCFEDWGNDETCMDGVSGWYSYPRCY